MTDNEFYRKQAIQMDEVKEHREYLNERRAKKGKKALTFGETLERWSISEAADKFRNKYEAHRDAINEICDKKCGNKCDSYYLYEADDLSESERYVSKEDVNGRLAIRACKLPMYEIHKILEDEPGDCCDDLDLEDKLEV